MGKGQGSIGHNRISVNTEGLRRLTQAQQNLQDFSWMQPYGEDTWLHQLSPELLRQVQLFIDNPDIAQARKDAFLAQVAGLQSNFTEPGWLDGLSETFIGTSNHLKQLQALSNQIGDLIGEYSTTQYEEDYDSAPAQAARERSAGVNPDLAGVEPGVSSDSSPMGLTPSEPLGNPLTFGEFVDVGLKGVELISGFVGQVQGWVQSDIANSLSEIALDDALRENIRKSFATVTNDPDMLDKGMIDAIKARYADYDNDDNIFEGTRLSGIKSREDLDKWIKGYNKKNPRSPVDIIELKGNAILNAARQYPNPYTTLRSRRAYDRAVRSISPSSPFVRSYINELEAKSASAERSSIEDKIQIKALLGDYGSAYQEGLKILQEAQNEINEYNRRYYSAKNGKVFVQSGEDAHGNPLQTEEDIVNLEVSAEAEEADAARRNAISTKYRAKISSAMRETLDARLEDIKRTSGPNSWHYIIASIIYPSMISYLENGVAQQIGAMLSRPKPSTCQ